MLASSSRGPRAKMCSPSSRQPSTAAGCRSSSASLHTGRGQIRGIGRCLLLPLASARHGDLVLWDDNYDRVDMSWDDLHVFCLLLGRTADRIGICVVSCLLMVESISYLRWWVKNLVRKKQGDGYVEDRFLPQELGHDVLQVAVDGQPVEQEPMRAELDWTAGGRLDRSRTLANIRLAARCIGRRCRAPVASTPVDRMPVHPPPAAPSLGHLGRMWRRPTFLLPPSSSFHRRLLLPPPPPALPRPCHPEATGASAPSPRPPRPPAAAPLRADPARELRRRLLRPPSPPPPTPPPAPASPPPPPP
ncbi:hypothetical protein U9M48_037528 [Paspalum notatum var. saurae]|uniref:Uncharacterized protein n=1 Tax=Paspalum notatum var. saurae TaxID=547442 RepID=A0AAQ3UJB8_PASNO